MKAPVEVQFAQKLAANEKTIRDRAVRKLKLWLGRRTNGQAAIEEEELMRQELFTLPLINESCWEYGMI